MNKLILENNIIKESFLNKNIIVTLTDEIVPTLKIDILKNTNLKIEFNDLKKMDIRINISKNIKVKIIEIKNGLNIKNRIKYYLEQNSDLKIIEINDLKEINEQNEIYLNGDNSKIDFILKAVSFDSQKYDIIINHNNKFTISNITTNGININDGKLNFNVSTYIEQDNCIANQDNRIINLTSNKCMIKPNLFVGVYEVDASHSAYIGPFSDDEVFYLERLGLNKNEATKLLIKGFLKNKIDEKLINSIIKKYWR